MRVSLLIYRHVIVMSVSVASLRSVAFVDGPVAVYDDLLKRHRGVIMRILNETSFPRPLLRYSTDMDNTLASFPFHLIKIAVNHYP